MKSGNETREVMYHFFLSDDTTQDTEAVLCAKHFLYTEVLSCYGKKQVRFRSDGATCFSSKEAKSAMVLFDEIAKESDACFETSYKVSVVETSPKSSVTLTSSDDSQSHFSGSRTRSQSFSIVS